MRKSVKDRGRSRRIVLIALGMIEKNDKKLIMDDEWRYAKCLRRLQFENRMYLSKIHLLQKFKSDFDELVRITIKREGVHGVPATIILIHEGLMKKLGGGNWHRITNVVAITNVMMEWTQRLSRKSRTKSHELYDRANKKIAEKAANYIAENNTSFINSMGGWSDIIDYEKTRDVGIEFSLAATILAGLAIGIVLIMLKVEQLLN